LDELAELGELGRDRPAKVVLLELELVQAFGVPKLPWDGARQVVAVQVELFEHLEIAQRSGNRSSELIRVQVQGLKVQQGRKGVRYFAMKTVPIQIQMSEIP
jgi:hypothetical protein